MWLDHEGPKISLNFPFGDVDLRLSSVGICEFCDASIGFREPSLVEGNVFALFVPSSCPSFNAPAAIVVACTSGLDVVRYPVCDA